MFKKRYIIIASLILALLFMSSAYALFSSNIKILGTTSIGGIWNVAISDVKIIDQSPDVKATSQIDDNTLTFNVEFLKPSDYVTYEITISNNGSIDAVLSNVLFKEEDGGSDAIKYETSPFASDLPVGTSTSFRLTITYDANTTENPLIKFKNITSTIEYVQK